MAALVVLAGRLPGHAQPGGDLRPPDAEADSLVNEHCEFCLCLPLCSPSALNPLHHLREKNPRSALSLA